MFLRALTTSLADALSVDDVARVALAAASRLPGVIRVGLALREGAGRELSFVSTDQDVVSATRVRWCTIDGFAEVPLSRAIRQAAPVLLPTWGDLAVDYPEISDRQRQLGTHSMAAIPLVDGNESVGGLMLSYGTERTFDLDDEMFFASLSAQLTQALRRGQAYQVQHSTSERLQRSLLPRSLPQVDGLSLGAYYRPGGLNVDVGGDWYDVLELADGSVLVSLGDVMGKGISAAVVMSEVRAALRAYSLLDPTPEVVLSRLDHLVTSLAAPEQIVTLAYGLFRPDRRTVELAVAGHPPPLLVPPTGEATVLDFDDAFGPALGLGAGPWSAHRLELEPGSTLLFYSDGLVETRSRDLFTGIEELRQRIVAMPGRRRHPRELTARLGLENHHGAAEDDVTLLAASVTPLRQQLSATLELPADATAARAARRFLRETMTDWAIDEPLIDNAELCVSELVTNCVIHAGSASDVTARLDDECLLVLVRDPGGRGTVRIADDYEPMSVAGRGLTLVDALSTTWSAEHTVDGTTVWFELEREPTLRSVARH